MKALGRGLVLRLLSKWAATCPWSAAMACVLGATAMAGSFASSANAEMVTFRAEGVIDQVASDNALLPFAAAVGDLFSIVYSYDTSSPDLDSWGDPTFGQYSSVSAPVILTVGAGSFTYQPDFTQINVFNDSGYVPQENHRFDVSLSQESFGVTGVVAAAFLSLQASGTGPLSTGLIGDSLPVDALDPARFEYSGLIFEFFDVVNGSAVSVDTVWVNVDSIERITPVPLPAAAWLLLSGLAGVAAAGQRRVTAGSRRPRVGTR